MSNEYVTASAQFLKESWYRENAGTPEIREEKLLDELIESIFNYCETNDINLDENIDLIENILLEFDWTKAQDSLLSTISKGLDSPVARGIGAVNRTLNKVPGRQFGRNMAGLGIDAANKVASDAPKLIGRPGADFTNAAQMAKYVVGSQWNTPGPLVPDKFKKDVDKLAIQKARGMRPGQTTPINSYDSDPSKTTRDKSTVQTTLGRYQGRFNRDGKTFTSYDKPYGFDQPKGKTPQERIRDQQTRGSDLEAVPWHKLSDSEKNQTTAASSPARGLGNIGNQLRSYLGADPNKSFRLSYDTQLPKDAQKPSVERTGTMSTGSSSATTTAKSQTNKPLASQQKISVPSYNWLNPGTSQKPLNVPKTSKAVPSPTASNQSNLRK